MTSCAPTNWHTYYPNAPKRTSLFWGKTPVYFADGTFIEATIISGIDLIQGSNPNSIDAINTLIQVVNFPFSRQPTITTLK